MPEKPDTNLLPEFDREFIGKVRAAMQDRGWLIPITDEQVEKAAQQLEANPIELPPGLQDPYAIFDPNQAEVRIPRPHSQQPPKSSEEEKLLAWAAREGGAIPDEVRDQMRRDRREAERKARLKPGGNQ